LCGCFNPRARAGRDSSPPFDRRAGHVSIHAPARGATKATHGPVTIRRFQSTRPRGARRSRNIVKRLYVTRFNPRARAGRDATRPEFSRQQIVSIHAPARGATCKISYAHRIKMFQSTRPRGARPVTPGITPPKSMFQSTRPRGARHYGRAYRTYARMFQSTRPRGARPLHPLRPTRTGLVSIHAPARGATIADSTCVAASRVSIHAPARGATGYQLRAVSRHPVSIHAPARGATFPRWKKFQNGKSFNPRARAGRDLSD